MSTAERIEVKLSLEKSEREYNFNQLLIHNLFNMIFVGQEGNTLRIYTAIVFSMRNAQNPADINSECREISHPAANLRVSFQGKQKDSFIIKPFSDKTDSFISQGNLLSQIWEHCETGIVNGMQYISEQPSYSAFKSFHAEHTFDYKNRFYQISSNTSDCGISWVKTELRLSSSFVGKKLQLRVFFDVDESITVFCPDYMLYFSVPQELYYSSTNCTVSFGSGERSEANQIEPLADYTVLRLREWVEDEDIESCKRCRLKFSGQKELELGKKKDITVTIPISQLFEIHGNQQFFVGLLVAFLASFSADYTRIHELNDWCFSLEGVFRSHWYGIIFPVSIILAYIAIVTPLGRVISQMEKRFEKVLVKAIKRFGVFFSLTSPVLFHIVFPVLRCFSQGHLSVCLSDYMFYFSLIGIALLIIYVFVSAWKRHIYFYNYL